MTKKYNVAPIVSAAAAGVAVGAAAVALTDKKNREKAVQILNEAKTKGSQLLEQAKKRTQNVHETMEAETKGIKEDTEKIAKKADSKAESITV